MSNIDKLRSTYPLPITFWPGEQPDAAKLSSISSQAKAGLNIIEKAIGDIWGTGSSTDGLHITNLGRVLGDAKYSNSALFNVGARKFFYIENLANKYINKTTGYLTFRPADSSSNTSDALSSIKFVSTSDLTQGSATHVAPAIDTESSVVQDSTTVFVDIQTGRFRTGKPIAAGDLVGYWVDPTEWIQGSENFYPSIIPDPRCDTNLLTIGGAPGSYYFDIPNRQPIKADEGDSFHKLSNLPARRPMECLSALSGGVDLNDGVNLGAATYFTEVPRFWDTSSAATNLGFHKYSWPDISSTGGALLTPGSIHLWDNTAKSVVEGLEFRVSSTTDFRIDITDTKGRLNWALTQDPVHTFYLITHGSSLSRVVWSLVTALANHDHTGKHYNENNLEDRKSVV